MLPIQSNVTRKNIFYSALVLIIVTVVFISCEKTSADNSAKGLSSLSGIWSGTIVTVPYPSTSTCTQSPNVWTTRQKWVVDDNGNIIIYDTIVASAPFVQVWTGNIDKNYKINVYTTWTRNATCGPPLPMNFIDKIILTANSSSVKDTVDFPLCPPNNCTFKLQYSLLKE